MNRTAAYTRPDRPARTLAALCLALWLSPMPAAGETYRWTDENGKVHFSDKPPPEDAAQSERIEVRGPKPIGQGREVEAINERTRRLLEAEAAERQEEAQKQAEKERDAARQAKVCKDARQRLTRLSGPFRYIDEDGQRYTVSEEQAEKDRQELRQWIEQNCS